MNRKVMLFIFLLFSLGIVLHAQNRELLSIKETLEIAQQVEIEGVKREYHPKAWYGNPAAKDSIYDMVKNTTHVSESTILKYIGTIGDETDILRLLSLIPDKNKMLGPKDSRIAAGVFAALARLSNRGYIEAGDILAEMTRPVYWENRNVGIKDYQEPFTEMAYMVFHPYAFSGREDGEQLLEQFLSEIQNSKRWRKRSNGLREFFKAAKKQEQEAGIWRIGKNKTSPAMETAAAKSTEERKQKEETAYNQTISMINTFLTHPDTRLFSQIEKNSGMKIAEETLNKVKEKQRSDKMVNEIVFLGLFPEVADVDAIKKYIESLPKNISDTDRKLLAASLFSLGLLAGNGSGKAQSLFVYMKFPSYWEHLGLDIYEGNEVPENSLTSDYALTLASFLSHDFWIGDAMAPEKVDDYLDYMKVQEPQRQIMKDALLIGALQHGRHYITNTESINSFADEMLMGRIYDFILKVLTPPVTQENLIAPPE